MLNPDDAMSETFLDEVRAEAANDPQYQQGLKAVSELKHCAEPPIASIVDGLLYHKLRRYVPKGLQQAIIPLYSPSGRRRDSSRPSSNIRQGGLAVTRSTGGHCIRSRLPFHLSNLESRVYI